MIISASRRTDIPAFYSEWFIKRIRAGYCTVQNPLNIHQISRTSLAQDDVSAIVFWSKNPQPLIKYLPELNEKKYRYYFQYTLNKYPACIEPDVPPFADRINTFIQLSEIIGSKRVIWRYDPIILSSKTDAQYHLESFSKIAATLKGHTNRVMISFLDYYKKVEGRLATQEKELGVRYYPGIEMATKGNFLSELSFIARSNKMEVYSCAEETDFSSFGIEHGKCVDAELVSQLWDVQIKHLKDKNQRGHCCCSLSKDIGVNNTCLHNCVYCYAANRLDLVRKRYAEHDPSSPSLWPPHPSSSNEIPVSPQLELFT